jgi:hypothetical protein
MCIIAICETRALNKNEFNNCWDSNSHGMGYAHWNGKQIVSTKGHMKKKEAWDIYQTVALPHVVHFRIRSAGEVVEELTHPFLIEHASREFGEYSGVTPVLFHNGTVSDWRELVIMAAMQTKVFPEGAMSDSRAMAIAMSVAGERILEFFSGMKWVVVEKDSFRKYGQWVEGEDGLLFSNGGFRAAERITYTPSIGDWPAQRDYSGIPVQTTFISPGWRGNYADRRCTNCVYRVLDDVKNEPFCLFKEAELANTNPCSDWDDAKKYEDVDTPERVSKADKTCLDCEKYTGVKKGKPQCKHLGAMKNTNLCNRFSFKAPKSNISYMNGRNCRTCGSYEGGMACIKKGVLKDMVACKEYEKSEETVEKIETYYSN